MVSLASLVAHRVLDHRPGARPALSDYSSTPLAADTGGPAARPGARPPSAGDDADDPVRTPAGAPIRAASGQYMRDISRSVWSSEPTVNTWLPTNANPMRA